VVSIERDAKFLLEHYKDSSTETKTESAKAPKDVEDAVKEGEDDIQEEKPLETLKAQATSQETEASLQPSTNNEDKGFQEEKWMKDWLAKHPECRALYVTREDGAIIMHALNDDSCSRPEASMIHSLLGSAKRLSGEKGSLSLYLETEKVTHFFSSLGEGFFLAAIFDTSRTDITSFKKAVLPLIQTLIHSLENA
jgi:predicted regulator of Ras-like GTPase activity (Roadblock/LC7/MglB family)